MDFNRCYGCMETLAKPGSVCPHCGYDNAKADRLQPGHALACGTLLAGHYVVGRLLGEGGFGLTYIAWNLSLDIPVCIKEYFPAGAAMRETSQTLSVRWSTGGDAEELRRGRESFVREARKAVRLMDLPSVVKVWDVFYQNDTAYIVMDYIEGETLKNHLLHRSAPYSVKECFALLEPVMRDLAEVHARGIIHRDIKPDNLMLRPDGKIVLLDLGAAKDLRGGTGKSSYLVASRGFSPIEQYSAQEEVGPWTDVYAMCALMYYCMTGRLLPSPMDRMLDDKLDLSGFPPAFAEALGHGLAIRPAERTRSMEALVAELGAALREKPKPAPEPRPEPKPEPEPEPKPEPRPEPARGKPGKTGEKGKKGAVKFLIPALLLAAALIAARAFWPRESDAPTPALTPAPSALPTPIGDPVSGGTTEDGLSYAVYGDCVSITGCDKSVTTVKIPATIEDKPVTGIADEAFSWCESLTGVTFPDSLTSIGRHAFEHCGALKTAKLPRGLKTIGTRAFAYCKSLTSITIPAGVEEIGECAFYECSSAMSLVLPESLTRIDNYAFSYCSSLSRVVIPAGVSVIGENVFSNCDALTSITVEEGSYAAKRFKSDSRLVTRAAATPEPTPSPTPTPTPRPIPTPHGDPLSKGRTGDGLSYATYVGCVGITRCNLYAKEVVIPAEIEGKPVTEIGRSAFSHCEELTQVTIPDSVVSIQDYAFRACYALTEIRIPDSVTSIDERAFDDCIALKRIIASAGSYAASFYAEDERLVTR